MRNGVKAKGELRGVSKQRLPKGRRCQVTSLEKCQCSQARIQRNPIACAMLAWGQRKQATHESGKTVDARKQGVQDDYMNQKLKSPSIKMNFA